MDLTTTYLGFTLPHPLMPGASPLAIPNPQPANPQPANPKPSLAADIARFFDVEEIVRENYPHSRIRGDANALIFPDLASGNIGYKLVQRLGRAEAIGPILMGMRRPVTVIQHGMTAADIVNLTAITAVAADMCGARPGVATRKAEPTVAAEAALSR